MLLKEIHNNQWFHFFYTNKGRCPYCDKNIKPWWGCVNRICQFSIESSKLDSIRESQYHHLMRFISFLSQKRVEFSIRSLEKRGKRVSSKKYTKKAPI